MAKYRHVLELQIPAGHSSDWQFGEPASEAQIADAEKKLQLTIPQPLKELYREFSGLRRQGNGDQLESFLLLPVSRLQEARERYVSQYASLLEEANLGDLDRCVIFAMPDGADAFWFMTEQCAWGLGSDTVGVWCQDGAEVFQDQSLERFLGELYTGGWFVTELSPPGH